MDARPDGRGTRWTRVSASAAWAVVAFLTPWAYGPPGTDAAGFTTSDAERRLSLLVGEGEPRPTGSDANVEARGRIEEQLRDSGYEVHVQSTERCGERYRTCATVHNVIGVLSGRGDDALLLAAHYDSVPEGPGAADDAAGVAVVLEVAARLAEEAPHQNAIVVLVSDGEELGLLGAEAFVDDPAFGPVRMVINLEARGTEGPSLMFETGSPNGRAVEAFAASPQPAGNSVASAIYELLPNDTDFTVFRSEGRTGLNFAFIGGAQRYHTADDDLEHLERGSLRHHGLNAMAAATVLADANLTRTAEDQVFFDFYGLFVVRYPEWLALPLAGATLALAIALALWAFRRRASFVAEAAAGLGATVAAPVLAGILAFGILTILDATGAPVTRWTDPSGPLVVGNMLVALAAAFLLGPALRRTRPSGLVPGMLLGLALFSTALSATLPGASYLLALPLVVALVAAFIRPVGVGAAPILAAAMAILVAPVAYFFYDALASTGAAATAVLFAVTLTPVVPHLPRGRRGLILAGATLLSALLTVGVWVALV